MLENTVSFTGQPRNTKSRHPIESWRELPAHYYVKIFIIGTLFVFLFRVEIESIVRRWITDSSWSHGFLIPLFSLYFIDQHKTVLGGMMQDIAKFALDLQGSKGRLVDPELAEGSARFQAMLLRSPAVRIEGGTDQILRNIIGERVLGLPADMRADKGIPFNEVPTGSG